MDLLAIALVFNSLQSGKYLKIELIRVEHQENMNLKNRKQSLKRDDVLALLNTYKPSLKQFQLTLH